MLHFVKHTHVFLPPSVLLLALSLLPPPVVASLCEVASAPALFFRFVFLLVKKTVPNHMKTEHQTREYDAEM